MTGAIDQGRPAMLEAMARQGLLNAIAKTAEGMAKTRWPDVVEYRVAMITVYHSNFKPPSVLGWSASIRGNRALLDGKPAQQLGHIHQSDDSVKSLTELRALAATIYTFNSSTRAWVETGNRPKA